MVLKRGDKRGNKGDQPVVYVSFHSDNDYEAQQIGQALRVGNLLAELFPCNSRSGQLAYRLDGTETKHELLLVAISNSNVGSDWVSDDLRRIILGKYADRFTAVYVAILDSVDKSDLPTYLKKFRLFDLSGRQKAKVDPLTHLVNTIYRDCGIAGRITTRRKASGAQTATPAPEYYAVTGIFEPARPAHEQWNELKRQIAQGEIDQRFLYWDLRSAVRWQQSSETSNYRTSQRSMNLLVTHAEHIIQSVVALSEKGAHFSFINLGVGTGQKDLHLLRNLLYATQDESTVNYFAVDDSFPMIQLTVRVLENLISSNSHRLRVRYIVDDFMNNAQYGRFIEEQEALDKGPRVRLIALLGTSLGNFKERLMFKTLRQMMGPADFLLLGIELVGDRTDAELMSNYQDATVREFLYGPIGDTYGLPEDDDLEDRFEYDVIRDWSDVPGCPTVTARARVNGHSVDLLKSTKYDAGSIEDYLVSQGFEIVSKWTTEYENPPLHSKYLLRLASS